MSWKPSQKLIRIGVHEYAAIIIYFFVEPILKWDETQIAYGCN
jgi:hypothetical protein